MLVGVTPALQLQLPLHVVIATAPRDYEEQTSQQQLFACMLLRSTWLPPSCASLSNGRAAAATHEGSLLADLRACVQQGIDLQSHPIAPSVGSLSSIDLGSSPPASRTASFKGPLLSRTVPAGGPSQVPSYCLLEPDIHACNNHVRVLLQRLGSSLSSINSDSSPPPCRRDRHDSSAQGPIQVLLCRHRRQALHTSACRRVTAHLAAAGRFPPLAAPPARWDVRLAGAR